ncbi:HERV-H LTR-associating protein 1 isoform X2 [Protopterus annectens]|uniref:HERV-H LTR-associating protein 1 isoform X2 n=1 Tax=Protopterus annectens TaxID=7888 RepID=UPI001CFB1F5A|nr:HERV-H LTR-associating protein 1 isoform X2 [Protopterus annectens]
MPLLCFHLGYVKLGKIFCMQGPIMPRMQDVRKQMLSVKIFTGCVSLILFWNIVLPNITGENYFWGKRAALLASTDMPPDSIGLAPVNLTDLVNTMLNMTLKGQDQLFSLLSVTSHSSYALHKVSILIYNISNFWNIDASIFPMRYCYCVNNKTNDLTEFTAFLVDIIGNSTETIQEVFKSNTILSVSQTNESDCIFLCVMAGQTDRDLSLLWKMDLYSKPVFNYTTFSNLNSISAANINSSVQPSFADWNEIFKKNNPNLVENGAENGAETPQFIKQPTLQEKQENATKGSKTSKKQGHPTPVLMRSEQASTAVPASTVDMQWHTTTSTPSLIDFTTDEEIDDKWPVTASAMCKNHCRFHS